MTAPYLGREEPLEETTFSLFSTLWLAGSAVRAGAAAVIGACSPAAVFTEHGAAKAAMRGISETEVNAAIKSAKQVVMKIEKCGTPQKHYIGANGITVIVEQAGRNAGKIVTVFRTGVQ